MNKSGQDIAAALLAALIVAGAAAAGLHTALGAHPWWALRAGLIGAAIGVALFSGVRWMGLSPGWRGGVGLLLLIGAGASAYFGKLVFVASFGDDGLAGRFWLLGWFGVSAAAVMVLATAFTWARR